MIERERIENKKAIMENQKKKIDIINMWLENSDFN